MMRYKVKMTIFTTQHKLVHMDVCFTGQILPAGLAKQQRIQPCSI